MDWHKYLARIRQLQEEAEKGKAPSIRIEIATYRNPERSGLPFDALGSETYVGCRIADLTPDCVVLDCEDEESETPMLRYIPTSDIYRISFGAEEPTPISRLCFIATAAYGSPYAEEVQRLRFIRDFGLASTRLGATFVEKFEAVYYSFSPFVASAMQRNPRLAAFMRTVVVAPLVRVLSFLFGRTCKT